MKTKWIKLSVLILMMLTRGENLLAQPFAKNRLISYLPSKSTKVNGLAIGPFTGAFSPKRGEIPKDVLMTKINGLSIELIGIGFFLPLFPSDPFYDQPAERYASEEKLDELKSTFSRNYQINGLSVSLGMGNPEMEVNGIQLSASFALVGKVNGISIAPLINFNNYQNGLAISLANMSVESKGMQLGFYNKSRRMHGIQIGFINKSYFHKGIQIGFININEKRTSPFFNWNF